MVYRGKPSAGCENCRKAKKRCDLGQPACSRCVKLNKSCSGYRDTSQLQIQDESQAVIERAKKRATAREPIREPRTPYFGIVTPAASDSSSSSSSSSGDETIELVRSNGNSTFDNGWTVDRQGVAFGEFDFASPLGSWQMHVKPHPDEVAMNYFFAHFTSHGHWEFLRQYAFSPKADPMLNMAVRACGMAALDNAITVPQGRAWSRALYGQSLGMLNEALRDTVRCTTNETLIAVAMLSYFENLTCDSRQSIQSWKAHMNGAMQLLKLRGKQQFRNPIGRALFRESRAQIMIHCLWDDLMPPSFLREWQPDLDFYSENTEIAPADEVADACYHFASLRAQIRCKEVTDDQALAESAQIELRLVQWAARTNLEGADWWRYYEAEVDDSPHVWNGMVHVHSENTAAAGCWQIYRCIRIMLTRTQEMLVRRCRIDPQERQSQIQYFKSVRRQLANDICAAIPASLGHATPWCKSKCTLISAYGCIWPLFFAGTVVLERIGTLWDGDQVPTSAASAQVAWILGRMDYISREVGIHWADGVSATLRGDFRIHDDLLPPQDDQYQKGDAGAVWEQIVRSKYSHTPEWIQEIERSGRGPRVLLESENERLDGVPQKHTKWLGRYSKGPLADADRYDGGAVYCRCASGEVCYVHGLND
ncbi:hypothetical protein K431DRAFT_223660 [Polychaeton citri CBS 116435]|uniref:Zn(2)-C6 fungal-type domain-containing protein n=1 Tax=Polychaeton citri CBS 116435 TaxID=1314669 RepID=A0A9P4Q8T5_9PEZI|nr:hypothetical protein K431DRAFT_223660 [Polychaeton citri CBS 116435]